MPLPPSYGGWVPQPPLPGGHDTRGHPVMCARAGYGVVEVGVAVGVGVGVGVTEADGVTEELGDALGVGELKQNEENGNNIVSR